MRQLQLRAWKRCMYLAQRCANMNQLKAIHSIFITHGLHLNNYAISKLVAFSALSDSGNLSYASHLFNYIKKPNSYIYNTLIRAYSGSSKPHLALRYFQLMLRTNDEVIRDHCTFHFALLACVNGVWLLEGKQIHNWVVKNGLSLLDGHVQTALIRLYAECKIMDDARKVFDEIPQGDQIQWNVLMNGYIRCGFASEALRAFQDMLSIGFEPDEFCVVTALKACTQLGALWQGTWVHEYTKERKGFESDTFIGTALVDMYAKCGCLDMAVEVFENMPKRNVFSWAAIVGGFALHGHARKAIHCLERMQKEDGIWPDGVVLLGVLAACTHAGLQKEGQHFLHNMRSQYKILPKHEHYSCVVDLLCRAGKVREAHELIRKMPMKPLASVWGALLSGCRIHNNVDLAELAVKELLLLENEDKTGEDGAFVQLSNIYLAAQRREDAVRTRKTISERGIRKTPGCSVIEVEGKMIEFVSGDIRHSRRFQICATLDLLSSHLVEDPL